ncbi:MAG: beta strand repeat-containing protein, partial [Methanobacteriaceae archaeon]
AFIINSSNINISRLDINDINQCLNIYNYNVAFLFNGSSFNCSNNSISSVNIVNNSLAFKFTGDSSNFINNTINYNRIFNNNTNTSNIDNNYLFENDSIISTTNSFDYNWWGNNTPSLDMLPHLNNYYVANITVLKNATDEQIVYFYKLHLNGSYNNEGLINLLPYFTLTLNNSTNNVVYDARYYLYLPVYAIILSNARINKNYTTILDGINVTGTVELRNPKYFNITNSNTSFQINNLIKELVDGDILVFQAGNYTNIRIIVNESVKALLSIVANGTVNLKGGGSGTAFSIFTSGIYIGNTYDGKFNGFNIFNYTTAFAFNSSLSDCFFNYVLSNNIINNVLAFNFTNGNYSIYSNYITYNRIFNNTNLFENNSPIFANFDYNWWGSNNLSSSDLNELVNPINYYYIVTIVVLSNSSHSQNFAYTLKMHLNGTYYDQGYIYFLADFAASIQIFSDDTAHEVFEYNNKYWYSVDLKGANKSPIIFSTKLDNFLNNQSTTIRNATNFTIRPTNNSNDINNLFKGLVDGDNVTFESGTYYALNLIISASINLKTSGVVNLIGTNIVNSYNTGSAFFINPSYNITINNFNISRYTDTIIAYDSQNITIKNSNISNNLATGIKFYNCFNSTISYNNIFNNFNAIIIDALYLDTFESENITINFNNIYNNHRGIDIFRNTNDIFIKNNTINNNQIVSIFLAGNGEIFITGNSINGSLEGIVVEAPNCDIGFNTISSMVLDAIIVTDDNVNIYNNTITNSGRYGISVIGSNINITNSTFIYNDLGVVIGNFDNTNINYTNNTFINNNVSDYIKNIHVNNRDNNVISEKGIWNINQNTNTSYFLNLFNLYSNSGDSLVFNSGTFNNFYLAINKSINIKLANFIQGSVILNGNNPNGIFYITANNVNISGFDWLGRKRIVLNYNGSGSAVNILSNNTKLEGTNINLLNNGTGIYIASNVINSNILSNNIKGLLVSSLYTGTGIVVSNPNSNSNNIADNDIRTTNIAFKVDYNKSSTKIWTNNIITQNNYGLFINGNGNNFDTFLLSGNNINLAINGSSNTISNANIVNSNKYGIYIFGANNKITSSKLTNNPTGIYISATGSNSNILSNNISWGTYGIYSLAKSTLSSNIIKSSGTYGIYNTGISSSINKNTISPTGGSGIYNNAKLSSIVSNTVTGGTYGIYNIGSSLKISSNIIKSSGTYGIYNAGISSSISKNTISGTKNHCIYNTASSNDIQSNTLTTNTKGIYNSGSSVNISSNIMDKNKYYDILNTGTKAIITINNLNNNNAIYNKGTSTTITKNTIKRNLKYGIYNLATGTKITSNTIAGTSISKSSYAIYNAAKKNTISSNIISNNNIAITTKKSVTMKSNKFSKVKTKIKYI